MTQPIAVLKSGHLNINVYNEFTTLAELYGKLRTCDFTRDQHAALCGAIYGTVLDDAAFFKANSQNPNVIWSLATLFTHYLASFVRHQVAHFASTNQNVTKIDVPAVALTAWCDIVNVLRTQLDRPITWYDLLVANNWTRVAASVPNTTRLEILFTGAPAVHDSDAAAGSSLEAVGFYTALVKLGGAPADRVAEGLAAATSQGLISDRLFFEHYVTPIQNFYRIKSPGLETKLQTISMRMPIPELNDEFGLDADFIEKFTA